VCGYLAEAPSKWRGFFISADLALFFKSQYRFVIKMPAIEWQASLIIDNTEDYSSFFKR
jgi:hypothetical protein